MRLSILLFTLLLLVSCNPKRDGQSKKSELLKVVANYYEALVLQDTATISRISTPNFTLFDDGEAYDQPGMLTMVSSLPAFKASFRFDSVNAYIDKEYASMYYIRNTDFTLDDSIQSSLHFLENATFVKDNDEWKLRFLHSTLKKTH